MSNPTDKVVNKIDSMIGEMDRKFNRFKGAVILWFISMAIFIVLQS